MKYKQCPHEGTKKCLDVECPTKHYCNLDTMFRKLETRTHKGEIRKPCS